MAPTVHTWPETAFKAGASTILEHETRLATHANSLLLSLAPYRRLCYKTSNRPSCNLGGGNTALESPSALSITLGKEPYRPRHTGDSAYGFASGDRAEER